MVYELVIIGAGLSGIRVALSAKEVGLKDVLILDYEKDKGGFHSSLYERPEFQNEKELMNKSNGLSYDFWRNSTVVGLFEGMDGENHQISIQTPSETKDVEAHMVAICTGSLEKPREANRIAGTRPAGVMTPMMALSLLERNYLPGEDIIIFDNNKVTKAISEILKEKGAKVTDLSLDQNKLVNIKGNARVNSIDVFNKDAQTYTTIPCDTVIFSEGKIPTTFFLKGSDIELDSEHQIIVDGMGRTNVLNIFAYGSCTNQPFDYFSEVVTGIFEKAIKL